MSVPKGERGETKLRVLDLITNLARNTARIISKDKFFPKSARWMLPKRIMDECLSAIECISFANSIFPSNAVEKCSRIAKQKEAHGHLQAMLTLIDLAYSIYPSLDGHTVEIWVSDVVQTDDAIVKWMKADQKRFRNLPIYDYDN